MRSVLHGDRVLVRISGLDRRGRREGRVVEVTERANTRLVGRVVEEHGVQFCIAENRRIRQQIVLAAPEKGRRTLRAAAGSVVEGRTDRTADALWPADRPCGGGARQLRRSGHGNRDRAAQARHAARIFRQGVAAAKRLPDEVREPTSASVKTSARWSW
jgi:ribonuclease R